ncbi:MAG: hypothetical protein U9N81_06025 [Bacillota bacterium]|nr:hypothetical protein [Bacillota bacterium]
MKKRLGILFVVLLLVGSFSTAVIAQKALNPAVQIQKEDKAVKVFVGRPSGPIMQNAYKENRNDVYKELKKETPEKVLDSIIIFKDFVTADQLKDIFNNQSIEAKRIWLAEPGTIGIGDAIVINNDIEGAVNNWTADFQRYCNEGKEKHIELNKNTETMLSATKENRVKVYAVLVSSPISELNTLSNNTVIDFIDLHYDEEAENIGTSKEYKVKYIDVPMRPDGIS